jgi:hypothetical protein
VTSGRDWFDNDALFLEQLAEGHRWAEHAAERLRSAGIAVQVTPMEVRAHIDDRADFADEWDMSVGSRAPCRLDVKSRNLAFTSIDDYPFETALVDTVAGWEAKERHPHAIILVSQKTEALVVIPVSTRGSWTRARRFDRVRGIEDVFYEVDRRELRPIDDLVTWLRRREHGRHAYDSPAAG